MDGERSHILSVSGRVSPQQSVLSTPFPVNRLSSNRQAGARTTRVLSIANALRPLPRTEGKCIPMVLKAASPSMWPRGLCTGVSQRLVVTISLFLMFALREVHSADRAEDRLWAPNTNTCWRGQCQAEFEMVPGNRGQFGVVPV